MAPLVCRRLATFVSILFGFPLAMLGLRDSLNSLLSLGADGQARRTLGALALITATAIAVSDIGLVVGISGALLGAAITYIFPSLIFGAVLRQARTGKLRRRGGARSGSGSGSLEAAVDAAAASEGLEADAAAAASEVMDLEGDELDALASHGHSTPPLEALVFALVPLGVFLGVLGVWMTVAS